MERQSERCQGHGPGGNGPIELRHHGTRLQTTERGSILVFVVSLWLPVFLVIIFSVQILNRAMNLTLQQKALDRCLYVKMAMRCENLSRVSELNQKLRKLRRLPGFRNVAVALAQAQDALIAIDGFTAEHALKHCGGPWVVNSMQDSLEREPFPAENSVGFPAPLRFTQTGTHRLTTQIRGWMRLYAQASCLSENHSLLDGETYFVTFQAVKSSLKSSH